jgi:hypothetical protein
MVTTAIIVNFIRMFLDVKAFSYQRLNESGENANYKVGEAVIKHTEINADFIVCDTK